MTPIELQKAAAAEVAKLAPYIDCISRIERDPKAQKWVVVLRYRKVANGPYIDATVALG